MGSPRGSGWRGRGCVADTRSSRRSGVRSSRPPATLLPSPCAPRRPRRPSPPRPDGGRRYGRGGDGRRDRKSTRLNSSHVSISYAVFGLDKKKEVVAEKSSGALETDGAGPVVG